ncbi:MAG: helix-turn-helix domain-containing protein [Candidatus Competibacteraceae bacterium]
MEANKVDKSSQENLKTTQLPVPPPVRRAIEKLGADIALARRRRRISQASLAERIGASVSTVKRLENGDLRVPIHFIARALHVFGEIERLANLLDTAEDAIGLALMDDQLPQRIRTRKPTPDAGAL